MLLMDLPPEVIIEMLSCINTQADLRAVSRTCKKLRSYNEAFQWQSLHVIIKSACDRQAIPTIDKPDTSFKIVAENAPGRLLEACNQGRLPCESVRQIEITSLNDSIDHFDIQSDCNKMLTKFPRLNHLDVISGETGELPDSSNLMVLLATLVRLPHLKTLRIAGASSGNEVYPPVPRNFVYTGERGSTIEVLQISIGTFVDNAMVLALLAWPKALRLLVLRLPNLHEPDMPALFAAIARHSHSLETLVTYFGQLVDLASNEVDVATPESDICGFDFGSFTSVSSLAMRMPRVLDQSISRRLPPRLKHLQFDCDFHEGNIKAPCFISLADEKRGKLPCLETITCWHDGPVFKLTNLKNPEFLQALAVMADIGEALGERGVVFTYSGWQRDC